MIYYADYEALEFNNKLAQKEGIYPYYLNPNLTEQSLCPIYFSACDRTGKLVNSQNAYNTQISFLNFLDNEIIKYKDTEKKSIFVWFHNIQYDFRIIIHELFHHGFKNIVDSEHISYLGEYETEKDRSFSIIGQNLSKYIGINLYYRDFKIMIRDTMSILNSAQVKILNEFGYPPKVDVDWNAITIDNLRQNMKLIEERNLYDIESLAKAIEEFKTVFHRQFKGKGTTAAGMSLDALKHYLCEIALIDEPTKEDKEEIFRSFYPMLEGDKKIISAACYHGGICTINKKYAGKILTKLQMVDINSSYPYSMTLPLPYEEGAEIRNFSDIGYSEYIVYIKFKHKGIPFQRCHTENKARTILGMERIEQFYTRSQFPEEFNGYLCINSIDLNTLKQHAKIDKLEFKRGINYKTNELIKDFIIPIYEQRKKSKGVVKLAIKLLLNSLYGKYAQDLSGIVFQYSSMDEYTKLQAIDNDTYYKPLASAVTAYSRRNWVNTVYKIGDNFIYGDTDSIYFRNPDIVDSELRKEGIIDDNELGKWGYDDDYGDYISRGKFLSKKNYILDIDGRLKLTCVGLSHRYHDQINFDNFVMDSEPFEIDKMVNVYGGKAMRKTVFKIKERAI